MSSADDKDFALVAPYIQANLTLKSCIEELQRRNAMLIEALSNA